MWRLQIQMLLSTCALFHSAELIGGFCAVPVVVLTDVLVPVIFCCGAEACLPVKTPPAVPRARRRPFFPALGSLAPLAPVLQLQTSMNVAQARLCL